MRVYDVLMYCYREVRVNSKLSQLFQEGVLGNRISFFQGVKGTYTSFYELPSFEIFDFLI